MMTGCEVQADRGGAAGCRKLSRSRAGAEQAEREQGGGQEHVQPGCGLPCPQAGRYIFPTQASEYLVYFFYFKYFLSSFGG